jgi:MFS transporter, YNFM family, putative membrane transport protein
MTSGVNRPASRAWPIFLLAAAAFASSATTRVADPLLPLIAEEFHTTVGDASIVATGYTLSYGLCQIVYGPVGDRFGKYRIIALMTVLSAIGTGLTVFAHTLGAIGLLRLIAGGTAAALIPLAIAYIGDTVAIGQRQVALARFITGSMLGAIAGQAFGGILGEAVGWRGVFVALAGVYLVVGVLLWNETRSGRTAQTDRAGKPRGLVGGLPIVLRSPAVRVVCGTVLFEGGLFYGAFAYVGAFVRSAYGASYTVVGALLACFGTGALLYALLAPKLLSGLGQRGMVRTGGALMAVAFASIVAKPPILLLVLPISLCGFGFFLFHNTLQTHATQMAPEMRGVALSVFAFCLFIGQATGIWAAGAIIEVLGYRPMFVGAGGSLLVLAEIYRRLARRLSEELRSA